MIAPSVGYFELFIWKNKLENNVVEKKFWLRSIVGWLGD